MPQRFLKPAITASIRFNACSMEAQNLYIRLLTIVDDFGRGEAHPRMLARHLYPYGKADGQEVSDGEITGWLAELHCNEMIWLYDADGFQSRLVQILRWTETARAPVSKYPPADLSICKHLLAEESRVAQQKANVRSGRTNPASPSSSSSSSSSSSPSDQKKAPAAGSEAAAALASRTQFTALRERIREASGQAERGELNEAQRDSLRKMRRALEELQKKQADHDFSPTDLSEFGLNTKPKPQNA